MQIKRSSFKTIYSVSDFKKKDTLQNIMNRLFDAKSQSDRKVPVLS